MYNILIYCENVSKSVNTEILPFASNLNSYNILPINMLLRYSHAFGCRWISEEYRDDILVGNMHLFGRLDDIMINICNHKKSHSQKILSVLSSTTEYHKLRKKNNKKIKGEVRTNR